MESVYLFLKITTFVEAPSWKKGEHMMNFVVPSSVVQYKLRSGKLFWNWRHFLTCVLDEVAFLEEFLFYDSILLTQDI